jgi:hypothetical protein
LTAGDGGGSPTIQDLLDGMDWMITLFATHFLQGEACSLSSSPPPDNADLMWASRRGAACRHMQVDNTHFFFFRESRNGTPCFVQKGLWITIYPALCRVLPVAPERRQRQPPVFKPKKRAVFIIIHPNGGGHKTNLLSAGFRLFIKTPRSPAPGIPKNSSIPLRPPVRGPSPPSRNQSRFRGHRN